jgi:hypothetical protein
MGNVACGLADDTGYAFRGHRRSPGFTIAAGVAHRARPRLWQMARKSSDALSVLVFD